MYVIFKSQKFFLVYQITPVNTICLKVGDKSTLINKVPIYEIRIISIRTC